MFFLIVCSVLVGIHLYLWKRLVKDTTRPGRARLILTAGLVVLGLLVVAALVVPRTVGVTESTFVAWPGYLWLGLAFYLFLTSLATEPVRLAVRLLRRRKRTEEHSAIEPEPTEVTRRLFLARASATAVGVTSLGLVGYGASQALGRPDVLAIPVRLRRLDAAFDGYRVALVSDIHLGPLAGRSHTARIVEMINQSQPDLVAIVGDLVDGTVEELGPAAEPLRDLVSRDGTYFVTGNHEYFVDDTASWLRELERLDVRPLRNENTVIRRGGGTFALAGVNDVEGEQRSDPPDFDKALDGIDAAQPTILLAHQPIQVHEAARRKVDLQLSGHTHGGQMWPFHYAVEAAQPALAGLSAFSETQLYVTRGAGFWGPPVRVGAPPDITVLSLQPDKP